ncbi:hypothetical protein VNO80_02804 [Phaseolus coccineus]|uniref:MYB transcription factor n=1 Tax=Phaseolus coccineus TaxID=3886 RepID=A0AAN9NS25_PHACN
MDNSTAAYENLPYYRVNHWREDEDEKLIQLVQEHGPQHWNAIAQHIQGRSGKSCRLRWRNHLSPGVNRNPFSKEEEERLIAAREFYGAKWATISKLFDGRTDNALKNRWHVLIARKRKEANNESLQELVNASSSSCPCNTPHHDTFFHMRNSAQTALAPVCPSASLSPVNFGSVPSFSESFPGKEGSDPFGLLNPAAAAASGRMEKGLFHSSSSAFTDFKGSSSSEKNQAHDAEFKDVTFYDFLGVGSDDDE